MVSLAIAGSSIAQTKIDSTLLVNKQYEKNKKNCIYLDTVAIKAQEIRAEQITIIDKLKAIREKQVEASTKPD